MECTRGEKSDKFLSFAVFMCYNKRNSEERSEILMKQIKTLNQANLKESCVKGGCGECQASCQSACKVSCTVANQKCENKNR